MISDLLSVPEVADLRGVSNACVYEWVAKGLLSTRDRFGRILVERTNAESFVPKPQGWPPGRPRKITKPALLRARRLRAQGATLAEIGKAIGVSSGAVSYALRRDAGEIAD